MIDALIFVTACNVMIGHGVTTQPLLMPNRLPIKSPVSTLQSQPKKKAAPAKTTKKASAKTASPKSAAPKPGSVKGTTKKAVDTKPVLNLDKTWRKQPANVLPLPKSPKGAELKRTWIAPTTSKDIVPGSALVPTERSQKQLLNVIPPTKHREANDGSEAQTAFSSFVKMPEIGAEAVSARIALEAQPVSLNLSATPLESVISIICKQTGINVVLLAKADQKVTINVKDMALMDALRHLSTLSGLRMLKVRNTIVMAEEATLKSAYPKEYDAEYSGVKTTTDPAPNNGEGTAIPATAPAAIKNVTRVISTNYQSATLLALSLKEFLLARKVEIVALPNTMAPTIESLSSNGTTGANSAGVLTPQRENGETGSKKVLLSGPEDEVEKAEALIRTLDFQRKQVEITVTIHDVSNDALKEFGMSWGFGQVTFSENNQGSINFGKFERTGTSFTSTIKALETADKAKLLASPNVSLMDGGRAFILVGERRQFPVVNGTNSNGQFIYSVQSERIGISLQVAADISDEGTITLAVKPEVSAITGFLQQNGGSYPTIATRESQSTLVLKDGQSMLLGGLLRDEEIKNLEQVPFLSKIPFFGELFKSRKTQKRSSQLVISITPRIIK